MMHTKLLLSSSALVLGGLGVAATFLPQEILVYGGMEPVRLSVLLVQALGAAYLGFAMLNWMSRGNLMGGIYNRPLALGNFLHFTVIAIPLLKEMLGGSPGVGILAATAAFGTFAVWFGLVTFRRPARVAPLEPISTGSQPVSEAIPEDREDRV